MERTAEVVAHTLSSSTFQVCRTLGVESGTMVRRLFVYLDRRSARNVSRLRLLLQEWNRLSNYWAMTVHCGSCS
jgi:hypothetical protein